MKVMIIADEPAKVLWEHLDKSLFDGIELIISCGDLSPKYLDYIVTFASCPLIYVHGNHDDVYDIDPPTGCDCIEDMIYQYKGFNFLGLGGSMRYKKGTHQYEEREMRSRIWKLWFKLFVKGGVDVLVTHSPAAGLGDAEDRPHKGFKCFVKFLDKYKPKYMLHGHVHMNYGVRIKRLSSYNETTIVNGYRYYIMDLEK